MKFRFIGEETSDLYGFKWHPGTTHDVEDAHAVKKLTNHPMFEQADGAKEVAQKFAPAEVTMLEPGKKPRAKKAVG